MTESKRLLAALEGKPGVSQDLIALEGRLLDWCESHLAEIRERYPYPVPDADELKATLHEQSPLAGAICRGSLPRPGLARPFAKEMRTACPPPAAITFS